MTTVSPLAGILPLYGPAEMVLSFPLADLLGTGESNNVSLQHIERQSIEWRKAGACRGLDATIFYPDDDDDAEEAKSVCDLCGVRAACLEHALMNREKAGVWGGATERERRRIIRQRRRPA